MIFICLFVAGPRRTRARRSPSLPLPISGLRWTKLVVQFNKGAIRTIRFEVIYGSSGNSTRKSSRVRLRSVFSADIGYPRSSRRRVFPASEVQPYAVGRMFVEPGTATPADDARRSGRSVHPENCHRQPQSMRPTASAPKRPLGRWDVG